MNREYYQKVYEGVLGKVIGVYMGRPFEGWGKEDIEAKFGEIDRFVAAEAGKPLVVADDDITGTLVFFKTLLDSGKFEKAEHVDFADNWLNYLIEHETVLWWGGYGVSTEHTAYINLKKGMLPPASGSIAVNGKMVAEQIGSQIFIDAFGLATPGRPDLAKQLAQKAASVSHDGEAMYGAIMQAVMVSIAFEEKDIHAVIKKALPFIPADSVIASLYPFVYQLKAEGKDWRQTFAAIREKFGYQHFKGGNCHMIPNHAVMALAFIYSENDFHRAQLVVNTAGWDTDCNAANVGCVMGVLCGLDGICKKLDFQSFFYDRLLLPTADGTDSVSDTLLEAFKIADVGAKIMGYEPRSNNLPLHHFGLKGSYHGYRQYGEGVQVKPALANQANGLYLECDLKKGRSTGFDHLSVPITDQELVSSSYLLHGTPLLYSGNTITFTFNAAKVPASVSAIFWIETAETKTQPSVKIFCSPQAVKNEVLKWTVPDTQGLIVQRYGIELETEADYKGILQLVSVDNDQKIKMDTSTYLAVSNNKHKGWISTCSHSLCYDSSICFDNSNMLTKNEGVGVFVTGNRYWNQIKISAEVSYKIGAGGLVFGYQGLNRYSAILVSRDGLTLVTCKDRDVSKKHFTKEANELEFFNLSAEVREKEITIYSNGKVVAKESLATVINGGAGYLVQDGSCFFRNLTIQSI